MPVQRITLIGYRAAGKSTIARLVAEALGWDCISSDERIETAVGMPISDYVGKNGWPAFRDAETAVLLALRSVEEAVIDCGGGVVERGENMAAVTERALVVWIDAPVEVIQRRLAAENNRPLLSHSDMTSDVLSNYTRRRPLYDAFSHLRIDTARRTPRQACEEILNELPRRTQA